MSDHAIHTIKENDSILTVAHYVICRGYTSAAKPDNERTPQDQSKDDDVFRVGQILVAKIKALMDGETVK